MLHCHFVATDKPDHHRCTQCGFVLGPVRFGPERCVRNCDAIPLGPPPGTPAGDRGLGDTVARWVRPIAKLLGAEDCGGCQGRQHWLNRWWPYQQRDQVPLAPAQAPRLLLRFPHGLGDCVQLTTVLLHLRHLVPDWQIDVASRAGTQGLFAGLCRKAYVLGEEPQTGYDLTRTLHWYEPHTCYADSPATKAERCLREVFRTQPIEQLCRYSIEPQPHHWEAVEDYLQVLGNPQRFAVLHYQGHSARQNKDLKRQVARALADALRGWGVPLILLDWDGRSPLARRPGVHCPGRGHALWGRWPQGDAAAIAALCSRAALCVGIDSGPGHVMGATAAPTLIAWTHHHPLHYFGLGDHVAHLVPFEHAALLRGSDEEQAAGLAYFEQHYDARTYRHLPTAIVRAADEKLHDLPIGGPHIVAGDHYVRAAHREPDEIIVRDVYLEDAYRVCELPCKPATAVDVGACFGAFASRLRAFSARTKIACVEAHPANEALLRRNLLGREGISIYCPMACTYETGDLALLSSVYDGTDNTGGSLVAPRGSERWRDEQHANSLWRDAGTVEPITLEEIAAAEGWQSIELLKLDCEGSEYSILEHADLDGLGVRMIVGEWHDRRRMIDLVSRRFKGWKWRVLIDDVCGLFWLWR